MGVEYDLVTGQQLQAAPGDQHPAPAADHDDDGLPGNIQIPDGVAVSGVLLLQHNLLELDAGVLLVGFRAQHQIIAGGEDHVAPGDNDAAAPLDGGHDDSLRQAQVPQRGIGPAVPGVRWMRMK